MKAEAAVTRSPNLWLWLGLCSLPLVFGWVLIFRRGYSKSSRCAGVV